MTYDNASDEEENEYTAYLVQYDFEQGTIKTHNVEDVSLIVAFSDGGCGWSIQVTPCNGYRSPHNASNPETWSNCLASIKPIMVMTENLCEDGISGGTTIVIYDGNVDTGTGNDDDDPPVDDSPDLGNDDGNTTVDPNTPVGGNGTNDTSQNSDDIDMVTQIIKNPNTEIFEFNAEEMIFEEGDKPLEEYDNKCAGINRIWQLSQANGDEYAGVLTTDGAILITQQLNPSGGGISGIYNFNGNTYYQYPASQGSPSRTYAGQLFASGRYFIPIVSSIHSHTPCINDGSDGITNNIINDDKAFASHYSNINHFIIGCNAIGQFNGSSNQAFNILNGSLNSICNNVN